MHSQSSEELDDTIPSKIPEPTFNSKNTKGSEELDDNIPS